MTGAMPRDFKKVLVWKLAKELASKIILAADKFPSSEKYVIVQQIKRSSISVPANIAEGCGRNSRADYLHFLAIAKGSLNETITYLDISYDSGILNKNDHQELTRLSESLSFKLQKLISIMKQEIP